MLENTNTGGASSLVVADRDEKGRIVEGARISPETEFKEGEHWREEKPYWDPDWLRREYVEKGRSAGDISQDFDCTAKAIRYHLRKHDIPRRSIKEAREVKKWGVSGEGNPMHGRTGPESPNWKGGVTPERQAFYASQEWAEACQTVWKRDDATCQRCGVHRDLSDREFHIHHIVSFAVEDLRSDPDNLVLLCEDCHRWVHSNENTDNAFLESVE